ncbi:MAG: nucleotide sugar dehydrogenase [Planctomycetes bacterium]|nr:nucleotide sugar dehydrogenase [Planctomycetota bacterium]
MKPFLKSVDPPHLLPGLQEKICQRNALVGVVGLGYVGLPFAVEKGKVGFHVLGIEQNPRRADQVNAGINYIGDVNDAELRDLVARGLLAATGNFARVAEMDVIVICVPTPLTRNLAPDLSYVEDVARGIAKGLRPGQLITLESTTYPGTTDEILKPILEESSGLRAGVDFFLAYSPERVDPGNARYTTKNTNKVVGANDPLSLEAAKTFYGETIQTVETVSSASAAEMCKVFENTFRAVNIALVNELTVLCDRMGLDVWEVLDAANTKPFGIMPFFPGPGVGGHCIPLDPHYLEWKAKEYDFNTRFIALAGEINRSMPRFVREKAARILNEHGIALSRAQVLLMGIAYKKDLDDWRESPALQVMRLLEESGANVRFADPFVPRIELRGKSMEAVEASDAELARADLVVITTDHSCVDYARVAKEAKLLFDTRGGTRHLDLDSSKVVRL